MLGWTGDWWWDGKWISSQTNSQGFPGASLQFLCLQSSCSLNSMFYLVSLCDSWSNQSLCSHCVFITLLSLVCDDQCISVHQAAKYHLPKLVFVQFHPSLSWFDPRFSVFLPYFWPGSEASDPLLMSHGVCELGNGLSLGLNQLRSSTSYEKLGSIGFLRLQATNTMKPAASQFFSKNPRLPSANRNRR